LDCGLSTYVAEDFLASLGKDVTKPVEIWCSKRKVCVCVCVCVSTCVCAVGEGVEWEVGREYTLRGKGEAGWGEKLLDWEGGTIWNVDKTTTTTTKKNGISVHGVLAGI